MPVSEIDMLGRRDIDRNTNWCSEYQTEEETIQAIHFILEMKEHGCLMCDDIPQCIKFTTLSHKQQKAVDIILNNDRQILLHFYCLHQLEFQLSI